jgi:hypothetical protein
MPGIGQGSTHEISLRCLRRCDAIACWHRIPWVCVVCRTCKAQTYPRAVEARGDTVSGSRRTLRLRGQVLLAVILAFTKDFHAPPSPIDAVGLNESVLDFHHLDEVHLFAVWSLSRVFPRHPAPVGEELLAVVLPLVRGASDDFGKKRTKLVVPMCDTPTTQDVGGDRTFQCRVNGIAGQQCVRIMVCQRVFPGLGDRFNLLVRFRSYDAHLANITSE